MRAIVVCAIAAGAWAAVGAQEPEDPKASLKDFAWLAGVWENGGFEEHWTTPSGGLMMGMGRHVKGEKTLFTEFLKIERTEDGIFYKALVGDQPWVDFRLVRLKDGEAVFENKEHDFPQRIVYRRDSADALTARVEGERDGKPAKDELRLKRRR